VGLKRLTTRRKTPSRSCTEILQPTAQCGQIDGVARMSHLRRKVLENGLSTNTPVGQTSTRLPANWFSNAPSSARPKNTFLAVPNTPKSVPPA
jgi:hypothetical protein